MNDFSEYTYGRALRFFEAYYPYDVEDIHYADVMLSMGQCKSIDELVTVSERLKDKIEKINNYTLSKLSNDVNKKLASCISSEEPVFDFDKRERMLRSDVNSCYDENVFRLFKENESITASACGECFINLSHCWDLSEYKDLIIREAKERANIDVSELLKTIAKRYNDFEKHWRNYTGYRPGMNGYIQAKILVTDDYEYLKQFNWRLLPWQRKLYSEIDGEEIKKKEAFEKQLKVRQEKREHEAKEEEKKRKEEAERKRKTESTIENVGIIISVIVVLGIVIGACVAGVENWLIAILVILALLKMGLK